MCVQADLCNVVAQREWHADVVWRERLRFLGTLGATSPLDSFIRRRERAGCIGETLAGLGTYWTAHTQIRSNFTVVHSRGLL